MVCVFFFFLLVSTADLCIKAIGVSCRETTRSARCSATRSWRWAFLPLRSWRRVCRSHQQQHQSNGPPDLFGNEVEVEEIELINSSGIYLHITVLKHDLNNVVAYYF